MCSLDVSEEWKKQNRKKPRTKERRKEEASCDRAVTRVYSWGAMLPCWVGSGVKYLSSSTLHEYFHFMVLLLHYTLEGNVPVNVEFIFYFTHEYYSEVYIKQLVFSLTGHRNVINVFFTARTRMWVIHVIAFTDKCHTVGSLKKRLHPPQRIYSIHLIDRWEIFPQQVPNYLNSGYIL